MSRRKFYPTEDEVKQIKKRMDIAAIKNGYRNVEGFIEIEFKNDKKSMKKRKSDWKTGKSLNYGFVNYFGSHPKINICLTWIWTGEKHPYSK